MVYRTQSKIPKKALGSAQKEILVRELGNRLINDIPLEQLKKLINYTTRELHPEGIILVEAEISIVDKQDNHWLTKPKYS